MEGDMTAGTAPASRRVIPRTHRGEDAMQSRFDLSTVSVFIILLGSSFSGLVIWGPAPAAAAPAPGTDSWSDSFDAPNERGGIDRSENIAVEGGLAFPGMALNTGMAADGDKVVTGVFYADSARTCVTANTIGGQSSVMVGSTSGLFPRDEVIIVQMSGPAAGSWEFCKITEASGQSVTLASPLKTAFTAGSGKVQLVRVPQFRDVTVKAGGQLTCSAWDGSTGGILCFRATGSVLVNAGGAIDAGGKGYNGGGGGTSGKGGSGGGGGPGGAGHGGAAGTGGAMPGGGAGGAGGFGGGNNNGAAGGAGGGMGSTGSAGGAGKNGAGAGGAAPGDGGTNKGLADFSLIQLGGGGGGGQGGSGGSGAGGGGGGGGGHDAGASGGPGESGGNGGTGGNGGAGGGFIWITAGSITVEGMINANGATGANGSAGAKGGAGGAGGRGGPAGGGGTRYQDGGGGGGGNGGTGGNGGNGGGGGAGGSIRLSALSITAGQFKVTATGGGGGGSGTGGAAGGNGTGGAPGGNIFGGTGGTAGAAGQAGSAGAGGAPSVGAGGPGLVLFESVSSSGVPQPAGLAVKIGRAQSASITSVQLSPSSLARWAGFDVNFSLESGSSITFEVLDAFLGTSLGKWSPPGAGHQRFNLSAVNVTSVRLKATMLSSGENKPSLADWSVSWMPNRAPNPPSGLGVDGHPIGSPWSLNLTSRFPTFNWTFEDPDTGQSQSAFNMSIWSGPGGTGSLIWKADATSTSQSVTFGSSGGPAQPLVEGTDYYILVSTRDAAFVGPLWGPATERMFHVNSPPGTPAPVSPSNGFGAAGVPAELEWSASSDAEGGPLTYDWQVSAISDFSSLRANGTSDRNGTSVDLQQGIQYFWRVRASDGYRSSAWSEVWRFTVTTAKPPRISQIPPQNIFFNLTRQLDLTPYGNDDQDGNNLTWSAALSAGPDFNATPPPLAVELQNRSLRLTAGAAAGQYIVTLKAWNSKGMKATGALNVTVAPTPPSNPPKITLQGSTMRVGGSLRIDLSKNVVDEQPESLRWEVAVNNTLVTANIENGKTLVLGAGMTDQETTVAVTLRAYDPYELSDEVTIPFNITTREATTSEQGLPWMLIGIFVVIVAVAAVAAVAVMKRPRRSRPGPAVMQWDKEALDAEDRPAFRGGSLTGLSEENPEAARGPAATGDFGVPPASQAPPPRMAPPAPPTSRPPAEEIPLAAPVAAAQDIPTLEEIPEAAPVEPAPAPPKGKEEGKDIDDILAMLKKG